MLKATTAAVLTSLSLWTAGLLGFEEQGGWNQILTATDNLPLMDFESATDTYLEGYIQALVDMNYFEYKVIVVVKDHKVSLGNLPKNQLLSNSIIAYVQGIPGVKGVDVKTDFSEDKTAIRLKETEQPQVSGVWFPQMTVLFQPLIADPRQPMYYVAYRFGDEIVGRKAIAVAIGDDFPIFRWRDVFFHGDLQLDLSAGIWAVFNFHNVDHSRGDTCELFNTDYLLGIPLTYAIDRWSYRLRIYHISSHLGDEFLCNHRHMCDERTNPSFEAIDFITSFQWNSHVRLYGGPGVVIHSDDSFKMKPLYVEYGTEIKVGGRRFYYHRLFGTPYLALFVDNWQERHWNFDLTLQVGYELSKLQGIGRHMRLYMQYHDGYSWEGQFFNERVQFGEVGFSWGF